MEEKEKKSKKSRWNLVILGVASVLVAIATTGVSLMIYHNSGDIYLDRSRPGYLPDDEELESEEKNQDNDYEFSRNGKITQEVIDEYLKNLNSEMESLNSYQKPFDVNVLSDERLGIPQE